MSLDTKCGNCGADYGLHHFETFKCPKDGVEENRWNDRTNKYYPQQWEETTFIDAAKKKLEDAAPELLEALKEMCELAERLQDSIASKSKFMMGKEAYNNPEFSPSYTKAKAAIKKATE